MKEDPGLQAEMLDYVMEVFADSDHWSHRVVFTQLCSEIAFEQAIPVDEFCSILLPALLRLANDIVPNIRICVARCIARNVVGNG